MIDWRAYTTDLVAERSSDLWRCFDSLSREEWLIVLAACCAVGFLFLKGWGRRGPC